MDSIIQISDLSDPAIQIYRNLTQGDPEYAGDIFLAESEKVIQYALGAGCKPLSFLMEQSFIPHLHLPDQWKEIPIYTGSRQCIRQLTGYTLDRGFLCAMERPVCPKPAAVLRNTNRVAIVRNISDPTDLGAIFRSAAALGMDAIFIDQGCCDPLYRRSVRVSMGTVFQVPWTVIDDYRTILPGDYPCIPISQHPDAKALVPADWALCERLAIVIDGKDSPDSYCIATTPGSEPLNMAAASAVIFWMLRKP